jgi:DNA-binding CsgD family transcriptional regulator
MTFDPYDGVLHTPIGRTTDRDERHEAWNAIAEGTLAVVVTERAYLFFDGDGGKALTAMERAAVDAAARAFSGKEIAYALGVAASTVSSALGSAAAKLDLESSADLPRLVRALVIEPLGDCDAFSEVEREVADALLAGKSNSEIACARGRSIHTIAKQVASILRKTGSPSRHVLRVRLGSKRCTAHKSG